MTGMAFVNPIDTTGEDFEIYRKINEELALEMNQPKESVAEIVEELPNWTCNECNEENEGSFETGKYSKIPPP